MMKWSAFSDTDKRRLFMTRWQIASLIGVDLDTLYCMTEALVCEDAERRKVGPFKVVK